MSENQAKRQIQVRYSETSSTFCSQFLVNATGEDVTIGFSSGYMQDPGSGETSLPIHSRITMTVQGAKRLHSILSKVLSEQSEKLDGQRDTPVIPDA